MKWSLAASEAIRFRPRSQEAMLKPQVGMRFNTGTKSSKLFDYVASLRRTLPIRECILLNEIAHFGNYINVNNAKCRVDAIRKNKITCDTRLLVFFFFWSLSSLLLRFRDIITDVAKQFSASMLADHEHMSRRNIYTTTVVIRL